MTKNLDKEGLRSIVDSYQLFYIDLWGVVHNGISLHIEAIKVLEEIIRKTLEELGLEKENISKTIKEAKLIEENSNQILDFTKEVKNMNEDSKIKIIEVLWKIVYSDDNPDMYENSLMRRLSGLLYLDPKIVGDIKKRMINNLKKWLI